uniref:Uncharacterized protein n=1 Tax=Timema douglasi TaxID=61478 RepID=A0A7R8VNB1_TIMDO|nr:unnamed protein product [Timema douglasi]
MKIYRPLQQPVNQTVNPPNIKAVSLTDLCGWSRPAHNVKTRHLDLYRGLLANLCVLGANARPLHYELLVA